MDIKMGTRTFLESEVAKKSLRKDLLEKMMAIAPDEPTVRAVRVRVFHCVSTLFFLNSCCFQEDEKENGITKLRYMSFRERLSSTSTLGFRVEGIKVYPFGSACRTSFLCCLPGLLIGVRL
jgi:1D-myo-inositol-triphosphate 3-kinase